MSEQITCPHCGREFELTAAVRHQLEAELRAELHKETERRLAAESVRVREEATRTAEERLRHEAAAMLRAKEGEVTAIQKRLEEATALEAELKRREREANEKVQRAAVELQDKLATETIRVRAEATRATEDRLRSEAATTLRSKDGEIAAIQKRLEEAATLEAELKRREREANEKALRAGVDLQDKLATETVRIREEEARAAEEHARRETAAKLLVKDGEIADAKTRLTELARNREQEALAYNELLRKKQELEEQTLRLRTDTERRMLESAEEIRAQMRREAAERETAAGEKSRLRDAEHAQQMMGLQQTIDDLKQKATQSSQQLQGEAQEVILKEILVGAFRWDDIADVEKGTLGADLLQRVRDKDGSTCGTIIWESKRTKHWSDEWLAKLRDDQRDQVAACAVLVTQAMPSDIRRFGMKDNIWVCEWPYAGLLAAALREGIIQTARARRSEEGRGRKVEMLYTFLTGEGFRQHVEGVVTALVDMQEDLNQERNAVIKLWKKRDGQILRAQKNIAELWGHLQGIAGAQLADIERLELPASAPRALAAGDGEDEDTPVEAGSDPELSELLFSLLPEDGASVGNKTLAESFERAGMVKLARRPAPDDYDRCKERLLTEGRIRKGKGKGGSVARVVDAQPSDDP